MSVKYNFVKGKMYCIEIKNSIVQGVFLEKYDNGYLAFGSEFTPTIIYFQDISRFREIKEYCTLKEVRNGFLAKGDCIDE